jgi:hypothetical protein
MLDIENPAPFIMVALFHKPIGGNPCRATSRPELLLLLLLLLLIFTLIVSW